MDVGTFAAYAAGFFDGEGWVGIGLERGNETRSDVHRISVYVTQRAQYRAVLDRFKEAFGGTVSVRDTKHRVSENWAEQADWHIHTRGEIERFCRAVQPYCIVKAKQIALALEYVTGFQVSGNVRDTLGRVQGRSLSTEEVERRQRLREALQVANARGPNRTHEITRTPRPAHRIDRSKATPKADTATVSRGEHRYNAALTDEKVREIRRTYASGGITMESLARTYGVSTAAIRQVIKRISWQHIE